MVQTEIEEKELKIEEINRVLKKLKRKKTAGIDGIPIKAWIYAEEELRLKLACLLQKRKYNATGLGGKYNCVAI